MLKLNLMAPAKNECDIINSIQQLQKMKNSTREK